MTYLRWSTIKETKRTQDKASLRCLLSVLPIFFSMINKDVEENKLVSCSSGWSYTCFMEVIFNPYMDTYSEHHAQITSSFAGLLWPVVALPHCQEVQELGHRPSPPPLRLIHCWAILSATSKLSEPKLFGRSS